MIAPNLRRVKTVSCCPPGCPGLVRYLEMPRKPWRGFVPPIDTPKRANLASLSLTVYPYITREKLQFWDTLTDLSKLRSLVLDALSDSEPLMYAAENARFDCLERLVLRLKCLADSGQGLISSAEMFLETLNPLKTLQLYGDVSRPLMAKAVKRHGGALRELTLRATGRTAPGQEPVSHNLADITCIRDCCPILDYLNTEVRRSESDRHETQCYRALGTLTSLTRLELHLDCSGSIFKDQTSVERGSLDDGSGTLWDSSDTRPRDADIRDALINCAVDEALARAIWHIVSARERGRQFSRLLITSGGTKTVRLLDMYYWIRHMSRSYLFTRCIRDDQNSFDVLEIGKEAREELEEEEGGGWQQWCPLVNYGRIKTAFGELWPLKTGNWRHDWSSRPLEMISDPSEPFQSRDSEAGDYL